MEATHQTTIDGINCELVLWDEHHERRSSCYCSLRKGNREYTGTLDRLIGIGTLEDGDCYEYHIDGPTIDRIEKWALKNGY